MKRILKFAFILICFAIVLCIFNNYTYGASFNPDTYEPDSKTSASEVGGIQTIGNTIIGVIRTAGSIVSVATLIVLGIKYMAGSLEERAQYKKSMIPYVIGAALVFGITNLLAVVVTLAGLF